MIRLALVALLLSGCFQAYAGLSVAPNGTVWITMNTPGGFGGGPTAAAIYACAPRSGELACARVTQHGINEAPP